MDWKKILSIIRLKDTGHYQNKLSSDKRTDFDSDQGRVIFSPAIRRMHDKTQVFPLNNDDNIHTRLTHSLEVAIVARSLGVQISNNAKFLKHANLKKHIALKDIPVLLSTIALCHDIGNPPYGHYGEEVISDYFLQLFKKKEYELLVISDAEKRDFTMYNGNAQGFRVLATSQVMQDTFGLNLTAATLSSYLKYPNLSDEINLSEKNKTYKNKLGVFQSEKSKLIKLRSITGLVRIRHPLAYLMEAADTICYTVMDIEDAFNRKYYDVDCVLDYLKKKGNTATKNLLKIFRSEVLPNISNKKQNYQASKMIQLRVFLLKHLVEGVVNTFYKRLKLIEKGEYTEELVYDLDNNLGKILKDFCVENIFTIREVQSLEVAGESVLRGLLDEFVPVFMHHKRIKDQYAARAKRLYGLISNSVKYSIQFESGKRNLCEFSDYYKLRLIVDFISGMTDYYALGLFQKLRGIKTN